ncbi:MAG TPA: hypothetical protein VFP55_04845 [Solirubrobacteraceae bacterium]|nr:hypothetical protein [Solirubrobacteraceae bacterium]
MVRRRRRDLRPLPERLSAAVVLVAGAIASGCGSSGSSHPEPLAKRLCTSAQRAAAGALRVKTTVRITSADPADVRCRVAGGGIVLAVEAQTSGQAWVEFDTTQVHFAQVFGPSSVHNSSELPQNVTGVGPQAFWVAAQRELVTTDAQEGKQGTYVTVTVTRHRRGAPPSLRIASVLARAALAASPAPG